jgi:hypothetical protein
VGPAPCPSRAPAPPPPASVPTSRSPGGRYANQIYATRESGWEDAIAESAGHTFATRQAPDRSEVAQRLLERHRAEQERRACRENYLRDHGLHRDPDRGEGLSISM